MNPATQKDLFSGGGGSSPEQPKEPRHPESTKKPTSTVEEDRPLAPFGPVVIKAPEMSKNPSGTERKPEREKKPPIPPGKKPTTKIHFNPESKPKMPNYSTKSTTPEAAKSSAGPAK